MTHVVDDFMTRIVHTIGTQSPLAEAHRLMNEHAIRHLPVLEGGKLVGMVSMRDLHLIETLKGVDPKEVAVEEAMAQEAYTVPPGTPLLEVARTMAMHKYGSAVIAQKGRVEGIFTTVDAMRALETLLASPMAEQAPAPRRKTTPRQLAKKAAPRKAAAARKGASNTAKRPAGKKSTAKRPARKVAPARKRSGR
ncbi:CBS domain-containing protein [Archangium gephyra]|uniref:CBS domain protein n=1 Tax=Archangium gephyra TaxID=48 RepID=A0AAC8QGI8_9BACT|nr:CBS domain-containing protein [Archangium gephyra]AKJ07357.1 CBS domain protein [Archangium gephyra]REG26758.1 CBS domain-containing protein [Archangium gephyra]